MQSTPHVAWVTTPADNVARRVELDALDIPDCIRRALASMPRGSSASCRASDALHDLVAALATERRSS